MKREKRGGEGRGGEGREGGDGRGGQGKVAPFLKFLDPPLIRNVNSKSWVPD